MDLNNLKSDPIIVVGGGFGGLSTLQALRAESAGTPIILIDPSPRFLFKPLMYEFLSGELELWEVAPRYSALASELGFIFVQDCVVEINELDIWKDPAKAKEMLQRTNGARTIPQIFIGDHYIGGNDKLQEANRTGELDKLLIS